MADVIFEGNKNGGMITLRVKLIDTSAPSGLLLLVVIVMKM